MKKTLLLFLSLFVVGGILAGCGSDSEASGSNVEATATIEDYKDFKGPLTINKRNPFGPGDI